MEGVNCNLRAVLETLYSFSVWIHWAMLMWDLQLHLLSCPISPDYPMATAAQKAAKVTACQRGTYRCSLHVQSPPGSPAGPNIQELFALVFGWQLRCTEISTTAWVQRQLDPAPCVWREPASPMVVPAGAQAVSKSFLKSGHKKT